MLAQYFFFDPKHYDRWTASELIYSLTLNALEVLRLETRSQKIHSEVTQLQNALNIHRIFNVSCHQSALIPSIKRIINMERNPVVSDSYIKDAVVCVSGLLYSLIKGPTEIAIYCTLFSLRLYTPGS